MLFQSKEFILYFLPLALAAYYVLLRVGKTGAAKAALIVCSLFFYGWWKVAYVPIFLLAVVVNYALGAQQTKLQDAPRAERLRALWAGIAANIGFLFFFKYWDFSAKTVNDWWQLHVPLHELMLPIGISFFTFQNIAYLVDKYEDPECYHSFVDYLLFLSFFPHLLAGPIVHHNELIKQFEKPRGFSAEGFFNGIFLFTVGLFKKVIVADTFAKWADTGFKNYAELNFLEGWMTSITYLLQLYFDFSGYTDMAIGLGLMFGVRMPENFNSPLKATSIIDFWQRWHMTLTRFINTYVYYPLLRAFPSPAFGYVLLATFVSMFLAGVWHGAGWAFVVFGLWHATGLVINQCSRRLGISIPSIISWPLTFVFVTTGFVFFRAGDLHVATEIISAMLGQKKIFLDPAIFGRFTWIETMGVQFNNAWLSNISELDRKMLLFTTIGLLFVALAKNSAALLKQQKWGWKTAALLAFVMALCFNVIYAASQPSKFLYFNF